MTCAQEDKIEPPLHDKESVSKPLLANDPFTADEKQPMMLQVKQAALRDGSPALTPEQTAQVNADIVVLQKP